MIWHKNLILTVDTNADALSEHPEKKKGKNWTEMTHDYRLILFE
jgi:hypothetical protein